jgi:hypothetical protein
MAQGTLARLTVLRVMAVDTRLPVTVAEDIQQLLAVMVEAEEGHRTVVEADRRTVVVDPHTAAVDLRTVVDMGGNTTLDSWPA